MQDDDSSTFDEPKSKSQRKREMHDLQDIGEVLAGLNRDRLAQLDLPETLLDAIREFKRLTKHEACRRQLQYIGRLMRTVDAEPIRAKLDEWNNSARSEAAKFHLIERWRERLIADDQALSELAVEYAGADIQQIRTLVRNARKEAAASKPPKSSRTLFKLLREAILEIKPDQAAQPHDEEQE